MRFPRVFQNSFFLVVFAVAAASLSAIVSTAKAVPIELRDGLVWVKVQSGAQSLNFVVDSGAATTVVNLSAAQRLSLSLGSPILVDGVGSVARGFHAKNFAAQIAGVALARNVVVLDLSSASGVCSRPIDGLLGADFFKNCVAQIDYAHREMSLGANAAASNGSVVLPLRFSNGVATVPVVVNGSEPRWARLDTGCTDALHWTFAGEKSAVVSRTTSIALTSANASGSDGATVQLGDKTLHNIGVVMHAQPIFSGEAGLLGNKLLSQFRVTIDVPHHRVILD